MRPLEDGDPRSIRAGDRSYRVLARIGSGGMGVVYFGRSAGGRAVAIKLVHPELAEDREFRQRFRREAMVARAVGGGYTAPVLDADPTAEVPWLVTEFLPSVSLDEAVRDTGPLPAGTVWSLAAGIAEALLSIHRAGIVHRDLKPANVLLTADGPRVIDFGIARAVDAVTVTHPGLRPGSPGFMSPEQVAGAAIGPAGDVFSLGSTLAFTCTGEEPFGGGPWHATMLRIQSEAPSLDGIADGDLRALILSCLDRDPARRPTADRLVDRIAALRRADGPGVSYVVPAPIAAEIDRRASEAENPPVATEPRVRGRVSRRAAWWGAVGVGVAVLTTIGVVVALSGTGGAPAPVAVATPGARVTTTRPPTATPVVRTSPATRELELIMTGDARVTSLTYTVNGRSRTLRNVKLPWRRVLTISAGPDITRWRLRFRFLPGALKWRVLVDGFEAGSGSSSSTAEPSRGEGDGAV